MSDFYFRKIKTFFHRIDLDKDGVLTQKDFENVAERFINSGKLDEVRAADLKANLIRGWETYFRDPITGDPIEQEASFKVFTKQFTDSKFRDELRNIIINLFQIYFSVIDTNGDGFIESAEYEHFFENHSIDKAYAAETFQAIDTNGDGLLSLEEFIAAAIEFFLSDDESRPTKLFWGPLV